MFCDGKSRELLHAFLRHLYSLDDVTFPSVRVALEKTSRFILEYPLARMTASELCLCYFHEVIGTQSAPDKAYLLQYMKYVRSTYSNDKLGMQTPSIPGYLSFDQKTFEVALGSHSERLFRNSFKKKKFSASDLDYRMAIEDDSSRYSCRVFILGRPDGSPHIDVQVSIFNGASFEAEFKLSFLLMRNFWVFGKKNQSVSSADLESVLSEPMEFLRDFVSFFRQIASY